MLSLLPKCPPLPSHRGRPDQAARSRVLPPCIPSLLSFPPHVSLTSLSFLALHLSSVQGLCAQLYLQGFRTAGVCRGPRGICLPPDTAPASQGPASTQLKLCGLWRCLSMPAGAGPAPLGALGLCACGDTIPWPWQDHPLPAVCTVTRSEPLHLPQLPDLGRNPWLGVI